MPLEYIRSDPTSAVQWATGLELLLLFPDPTRMFLTTDHPNGGPFTAYPQVIEWLMNRPRAMQCCISASGCANRKADCPNGTGVWSRGDFCHDFQGPAKALGACSSWAFGCWALLAEIRCYKKQADFRKMFENPDWVMHHGQVIVKDGKIRKYSEGRTLLVRPKWDENRRKSFYAKYSHWISFQPEHYAFGGELQVRDGMEVPCG